jgi:hypothetical protein
MTKICLRCSEAKTLDSFTKDRSQKDGLFKYCRACDALRHKTYRDANREAHLDRKRATYLRNREAIAAASRAYRISNPEKFRKYGAQRDVRRSEQLHPAYIAHLMDLPKTAISPEMLELKRMSILIHRALKAIAQRAPKP